MKKLIFLSFILLAAVTSCKKETPFNEAIIGKWEVQIEQQIYYLQDVKKFEYVYYYDSNALDFEFTSGGSIIIYQDGDVYGTSTFTLNGNKVIIGTGDNNMEWNDVSVNGKTLTWTEISTQVVNQVTYNVDIIYTATKTN